jgi:hypothetical protein
LLTTSDFQVTQIINIVLDAAEKRGLLMTSEKGDAAPAAMPGGKMSYRDHVVRELVDTERKYVQDLENLHELKKSIEQKGVIPGDVVHDIFLNINAILDFKPMQRLVKYPLLLKVLTIGSIRFELEWCLRSRRICAIRLVLMSRRRRI